MTYNTHGDNEFHLTKSDGITRVFKQSARGLFYMNFADTKNGVALITTVANNCSNYSNCNYSCAVLARKLQKTIGRPGTCLFINIVQRNIIPNCPITPKDTVAAEPIFGPDIGSLKGKTVL